jgi:Asp-tRNA(Asn)/Glu-tRNA(Gln) amidotransferase A subunit family amidase
MTTPWPPLAELATQVRTGRVSSRELVAEALARIERVDPEVHAWVTVDAERAFAEATRIDEMVAAGGDPGLLAGIPIGVKDLEHATGFVTTNGSLLHAGDPPATSDSVLVARLRAAGCVVLGKLNTPEFGFSADTTNAVAGSTHNPWSLGRSPGGSSGGSASALASGMVPLATGGDSGGSIRIPAALCGLPGFKPSNGRVPVGGPTPPGNGWLGVRSVMATTVADTVHALGVVVGHDPTDLIGLPTPAPAWLVGLEPELPTRVIWSPAPGWPVDDEIAAVCAAAIERLAAVGVEVIEADRFVSGVPLFDYFNAATVFQQRLHGHRRDTPEWALLDEGIRSQIDHADRHVTAAGFATALDSAHLHNYELEGLFRDAPLLLCPTVAGQTARCAGQGTVNGEETIFWAPFTQLFNLTKHPVGSMPCGFTGDSMPVGMQMIGSQHDDLTVLRTMLAWEALFAHDRQPQVRA